MVISRIGLLADDLKRNSSAVLLAMRLAFGFEAEADLDILKNKLETESGGQRERSRILALTGVNQKQQAASARNALRAATLPNYLLKN